MGFERSEQAAALVREFAAERGLRNVEVLQGDNPNVSCAMLDIDTTDLSNARRQACALSLYR